jgi:acyl carrier protein
MTLDDRLQAIFREVFGDDDLVVSDEATAGDFELWDSLTHVTLVYSIEAEFGIDFSESEYAGFANVGELKALVESKVGLAA